MLTGKHQKKKSFKDLFKKNKTNNRQENDEALDASLMRNDRKYASKTRHFDQTQTELLDKLYKYHRVDMKRLKRKFNKKYQFEAFIRKNQVDIDDARTANIVILGTSGSGKTKVWWSFLNYYRASYLESNSWGLSPKDFYYIITEKIMNISVDILIEYNYYTDTSKDKEALASTCLSKNDLVEWTEFEYKLELQDDDINEGYMYFQDLISKLEKISKAINDNVQLEEKRKSDGEKPNWDKIQELRNIEKEMKQFKPSIATKISSLWTSQSLRNIYLYQYGLHNARNLFYYIDHIDKFALQKQRADRENKEQTRDDQVIHSKPRLLKTKSSKSVRMNKKKTKWEWEWEWSFEEILRCQIRTTGVIQQSSNLGPFCDNELEKNFSLKLRLWDVGGAQNERKKWKYVLNTKNNTADIDCVIFVVNLMAYYKKSWESHQNGLLQSLQLFACLLSHGDAQHEDMYHMNKDKDMDKEEYDICIDYEVKRAINDISLFYIIFTDSQGLQQMLRSGTSFNGCFADYNGDNSVLDVQNFIENKFRTVIDETNQRTKEKNGRIFEQTSIDIGAAPYMLRTGSVNKYRTDMPPSMRRTKTVPHSMRTNVDKKEDDDDDEFHSDFELSDHSDHSELDHSDHSEIEGQKRLKCRFVSVIDHEEMKNVMNEIVKCSFLNKNALDPVVHSLVD